jgi:hypothetical protein
MLAISLKTIALSSTLALGLLVAPAYAGGTTTATDSCTIQFSDTLDRNGKALSVKLPPLVLTNGQSYSPIYLNTSSAAAVNPQCANITSSSTTAAKIVVTCGKGGALSGAVIGKVTPTQVPQPRFFKECTSAPVPTPVVPMPAPAPPAACNITITDTVRNPQTNASMGYVQATSVKVAHGGMISVYQNAQVFSSACGHVPQGQTLACNNGQLRTYGFSPPPLTPAVSWGAPQVDNIWHQQCVAQSDCSATFADVSGGSPVPFGQSVSVYQNPTGSGKPVCGTANSQVNLSCVMDPQGKSVLSLGAGAWTGNPVLYKTCTPAPPTPITPPPPPPTLNFFLLSANNPGQWSSYNLADGQSMTVYLDPAEDGPPVCGTPGTQTLLYYVNGYLRVGGPTGQLYIHYTYGSSPYLSSPKLYFDCASAAQSYGNTTNYCRVQFADNPSAWANIPEGAEAFGVWLVPGQNHKPLCSAYAQGTQISTGIACKNGVLIDSTTGQPPVTNNIYLQCY